MTQQELFTLLKKHFQNIITENNLTNNEISIKAKTLTPLEAIGETKRKDYPILLGKELMLEAEFKGKKGQAFTDSPSDFTGSLAEVLDLDLLNDPYARGIFIATLNAVMAYLGLTDKTIHCKNDEPEQCAKEFVNFLHKNYQSLRQDTLKITLIGFQPAILAAIAPHFRVRVLDLNPQTIGQQKSNITVEDGAQAYAEATAWADLILCTGSTICNGSLVNFLDIDKEVLFYGTTLSGTAKLLNLKRACFCSH